MAWSAPEDWSRWDPEKLLVCPYDEVHMIKAKRFQRHLLKCRENHPGKDFVTCPFNAKHVMLRSEVRHHVSRCPDRSVIEQYNYKGSEKDEDGLYFKGNTSVPSYHKTEDIQESSESWDTGEERNFQWTEHNKINTPQWKHGMTQTSHAVTDTLSLSPEEREKFKRQMRREAAIRNANSGMLLPSQRWASSQGYNKSSDNYMMQHSSPTNFGQSRMVNSSVQEVQPVVNTGVSVTNTASKQRNPIFEYCAQRMQNSSECANEQNMVGSQRGACKNEEVLNESNLTLQRCTNEGVSSQHARNTLFTSFTPDNVKLRSDFAKSGMENKSVLQEARSQEGEGAIFNVYGRKNLLTSPQHKNSSFTHESSPVDPMKLRPGFIEHEMEKTLRLHGNMTKPEVAAVSSVCGQPTYPTSSRANGPHLAGVGRARHFAEARKNNFGGICYSQPKNAGLDAARPASAGRGRGMLNYFTYSS